VVEKMPVLGLELLSLRTLFTTADVLLTFVLVARIVCVLVAVQAEGMMSTFSAQTTSALMLSMVTRPKWTTWRLPWRNLRVMIKVLAEVQSRPPLLALAQSLSLSGSCLR
jgi:hypothetical protein